MHTNWGKEGKVNPIVEIKTKTGEYNVRNFQIENTNEIGKMLVVYQKSKEAINGLL